MVTQRKYKPNVIMQSYKIPEKLKRRQLEVENWMNEPKWFTTNKMIMDCVIQYVRSKWLKEGILAPLNQVRI